MGGTPYSIGAWGGAPYSIGAWGKAPYLTRVGGRESIFILSTGKHFFHWAGMV